MKKALLILTSMALVISMASCNIIINPDNTDEGSDTDVTYPHSDMELADLNAVIATTANQSFPVSTFRYFFMDSYSAFINNYYYYLSYYGLDVNVPLHDQINSTTNESWYKYFLDSGKSAFEQYAKFAEKAIEEGMSLSEADLAEIDAYLDGIQKTAEEYDMTFEEYMADYMGDGMTREMIREAVKISQLGYNYYEKIYYAPEYTDDEIEAEYIKNIKNYALIDFCTVSIEALYDETDDEDAKSAAIADAKKKGDDIAALIEGGKSFAEAVIEICPELAEKKSASTSTGDEETTEYKTDADYLVEGAYYAEGASYAFLFDEGTEVGDVKIDVSEAGDVTLVQAVKLPYKDTSRTVNVRHILLDASKYDTQEEAAAAAEALLKQINESNDPKATFISLVADNSADGGSVTNGGLYEGVFPGDMIDEFDAWCFDESRKIGDTGVVFTDYGYHVMYMEGFGDELWYSYVDGALRDAEFEALSEAIYEEVKIEYNEELLDKIAR